MNSPIANLFLALQANIAGLADTDGNKYFKFVDQDLGQMESPTGENRYPVLFPCVLIDIDDINFNSIASNSQMAKGKVVLRLGFPPFSASNATTPITYAQKAIYYYELEQILHNALHPDPLQRRGRNTSPKEMEKYAAASLSFSKCFCATTSPSYYNNVRKKRYLPESSIYVPKMAILLLFP